jgi:hypothetical protein
MGRQPTSSSNEGEKEIVVKKMFVLSAAVIGTLVLLLAHPQAQQAQQANEIVVANLTVNR